MLFFNVILSVVVAATSVVQATPKKNASANRASATITNQTTCNGNTYTYNEMAGYGFVPSNARDKYSDTLGGYGSSIAIEPSTWKKLGNGSYTGTLWAIPDRGWYEAPFLQSSDED